MPSIPRSQHRLRIDALFQEGTQLVTLLPLRSALHSKRSCLYDPRQQAHVVDTEEGGKRMSAPEKTCVQARFSLPFEEDRVRVWPCRRDPRSSGQREERATLSDSLLPDESQYSTVHRLEFASGIEDAYRGNIPAVDPVRTAALGGEMTGPRVDLASYSGSVWFRFL